MNFMEFDNVVEELRSRKPILFGLKSDNIASDEELIHVENYYQIQLPESYKQFLKKYGGGYFVYTVVYSCDTASKFYIIHNVLKEWVDKYNFLPVIDFQTGDMGGFKINNKKCDELFCIYNHDEKQVVESEECDFFQALVMYGLKL